MADEVIEVFSISLTSPQSLNAKAAAQALGDFGPRAAGALPRLRAVQHDQKTPAECAKQPPRRSRRSRPRKSRSQAALDECRRHENAIGPIHP